MTSAPEPPAGGPSANPLELPDPPLVDREAGIRLRPWAATATDVAALVAAWTNPEIVAENQVPGDTSPSAARSWLRREPARRGSGRNLDLVIASLGDRAAGPPLGEVALRNIDRARRRAELSWWVLPGHRGRGVAGPAVRLLTTWSLSPDGLHLAQVWARIAPSNERSARVARSAGLADLGVAGGSHVWARSSGAGVAGVRHGRC